MTDRRKEDEGANWVSLKTGEVLRFSGHIRDIRVNRRSGKERRQEDALAAASVLTVTSGTLCHDAKDIITLIIKTIERRK